MIGINHHNYIYLEQQPDGLWDLKYHGADSGLWSLSFEMQAAYQLRPLSCAAYSQVLDVIDAMGNPANAAIQTEVMLNTATRQDPFSSSAQASVSLAFGMNVAGPNVGSHEGGYQIPSGDFTLMSFDFGSANPGFIADITGVGTAYNTPFTVTFAGLVFNPFFGQDPDSIWLAQTMDFTYGATGDPIAQYETWHVLTNSSFPLESINLIADGVESWDHLYLQSGGPSSVDIDQWSASHDQDANGFWLMNTLTMDGTALGSAQVLPAGEAHVWQFDASSRTGIGGVTISATPANGLDPNTYTLTSSLSGFLLTTHEVATWESHLHLPGYDYSVILPTSIRHQWEDTLGSPQYAAEPSEISFSIELPDDHTGLTAGISVQIDPMDDETGNPVDAQYALTLYANTNADGNGWTSHRSGWQKTEITVDVSLWTDPAHGRSVTEFHLSGIETVYGTAANIPLSGKLATLLEKHMVGYWKFEQESPWYDFVTGAAAELPRGASPAPGMASSTSVSIGIPSGFSGFSEPEWTHLAIPGEFTNSSWQTLTLPTNGWTLSVWVKSANDGTGVSVSTSQTWSNLYQQTSNSSYVLDAHFGQLGVGNFLNPNGNVVPDANRLAYEASAVLRADSDWHHVCCVYDLTDTAIYIDGAKVGNVPYANGDGSALTVPTSINNFNTGVSAGQEFADQTKDFRVFDGALSESEVAELHSPANLLGQYIRMDLQQPLDQGSPFTTSFWTKQTLPQSTSSHSPVISWGTKQTNADYGSLTVDLGWDVAWATLRTDLYTYLKFDATNPLGNEMDSSVEASPQFFNPNGMFGTSVTFDSLYEDDGPSRPAEGAILSGDDTVKIGFPGLTLGGSEPSMLSFGGDITISMWLKNNDAANGFTIWSDWNVGQRNILWSWVPSEGGRMSAGSGIAGGAFDPNGVPYSALPPYTDQTVPGWGNVPQGPGVWLRAQCPELLDTDAWVHCVYMRDGNNLRMFINGAEVTYYSANDWLTTIPNVDITGSTGSTTDHDVGIGCMLEHWGAGAAGTPSEAGMHSGSTFDGAIDEVAVWGRALSSAEILTVYSGKATGQWGVENTVGGVIDKRTTALSSADHLSTGGEAKNHIVMTWDGVNEAAIFINGVLADRGGDLFGVEMTANQSIDTIWLGVKPDDLDTTFTGLFDEFALWHTVLPTTIIQQIYAEQVAGGGLITDYTWPVPASSHPLAGGMVFWWDAITGDDLTPGRLVAIPATFVGDTLSTVTTYGEMLGVTRHFEPAESSYALQGYMDISSIDIGTINGDMSFSAWVRQGFGVSTNTFGTLIQSGANPNIQLSFVDDTNGGMFVDATTNLLDGTAATLVFQRDLRDGNWHHIVVTRNQAVGEHSLFIDGVMVATDTFTAGAIFGGAFGMTEASLGARVIGGTVDQPYDGDLVEPAIWSRVLTLDEIQEIRAKGMDQVDLLGTHARVAAVVNSENVGQNFNSGLENGAYLTDIPGNSGTAWDQVLVLDANHNPGGAISYANMIDYSGASMPVGAFPAQVENNEYNFTEAVNLFSFGPHSVSAWIRPTFAAGAAPYPILTQRAQSSEASVDDSLGFYLIADSNSSDVGKLFVSHGAHVTSNGITHSPDFIHASTIANVITEDTNPTGFAWSHVAFVHTGTTIKFFINGAFDSEYDYHLNGKSVWDTVANAALSAGGGNGNQIQNHIVIGGRVHTDVVTTQLVATGFKGEIDGVNLYNFALTGQEVSAIYAEDNTPAILSLVGSPTVTLTEGDTYTEEGLTAIDPPTGASVDWATLQADPNFSIATDLDTGTVGSYSITYSYLDANGNPSATSRQVTVDAAGAAVTHYLYPVNGNQIAGTPKSNGYYEADVNWVDEGCYILDASDWSFIGFVQGPHSIYRVVSDGLNNGHAYASVPAVDFTTPGVYLIYYTDPNDGSNQAFSTVVVPASGLNISYEQIAQGNSTPDGGTAGAYTYKLILDNPYASDGWWNLDIGMVVQSYELGVDMQAVEWGFYGNPIGGNLISLWDTDYGNGASYLPAGTDLHIATFWFTEEPPQSGLTFPIGYNYVVAGGASISTTQNAALAPEWAYSVTSNFVVGSEPDPILQMVGQNPLYHAWGSAYTDPGVNLIESDGTFHSAGQGSNYSVVSGDIVPSNTHDQNGNSTEGSYTITYDVTDATSGKTAHAERTVLVQKLFGSMIGRADGTPATVNPNLPTFAFPDGQNGIDTGYNILFADGTVVSLDADQNGEFSAATSLSTGLTISNPILESAFCQGGDFIVGVDSEAVVDQIAWAKSSDSSPPTQFHSYTLTVQADVGNGMETHPAKVKVVANDKQFHSVVAISEIGMGEYATTFSQADLMALGSGTAPNITVLTPPVVGTFTEHGSMTPSNPNVDYANSIFATLGIEGYGFTYVMVADTTSLADRVVVLEIISDGATVTINYDPFTGILYEWNGQHHLHYSVTDEAGDLVFKQSANGGTGAIDLTDRFENSVTNRSIVALGIADFIGKYAFITTNPANPTDPDWLHTMDLTEFWEYPADIAMGVSLLAVGDSFGSSSMFWNGGAAPSGTVLPTKLNCGHYCPAFYTTYVGYGRGLMGVDTGGGNETALTELFDAQGHPAVITAISSAYFYDNESATITTLMAVGHTVNGGIVFRSEDAGSSWERVVTNPERLTAISNCGPAGYGVWAVGGADGVFGISFNDGLSFVNVSAVEDSVMSTDCCAIFHAGHASDMNHGTVSFQDQTGQQWYTNFGGKPGSWAAEVLPIIDAGYVGLGTLRNPSNIASGFGATVPSIASDMMGNQGMYGIGTIQETAMLFTTRPDAGGANETDVWAFKPSVTDPNSANYGWQKRGTDYMSVTDGNGNPVTVGNAVWVSPTAPETLVIEDKDTTVFQALFETPVGYVIGTTFADPNAPAGFLRDPMGAINVSRVDPRTTLTNSCWLHDDEDGTFSIRYKYDVPISHFYFQVITDGTGTPISNPSLTSGLLTVTTDGEYVTGQAVAAETLPSGDGILVSGLELNGNLIALHGIVINLGDASAPSMSYAQIPHNVATVPNNVKWFATPLGDDDFITGQCLIVRESLEGVIGEPNATVFMCENIEEEGIPLSSTANFHNTGAPLYFFDEWLSMIGVVVIPQEGGVVMTDDIYMSDESDPTVFDNWNSIALGDSNGNPVTIYQVACSPSWGWLMACGTSVNSAGEIKGCVFKCTDLASQTWSLILEVPNADFRVMDTGDDGKWYVGGSDTLVYRSINDGLSWAKDTSFNAGTEAIGWEHNTGSLQSDLMAHFPLNENATPASGGGSFELINWSHTYDSAANGTSPERFMVHTPTSGTYESARLGQGLVTATDGSLRYAQGQEFLIADPLEQGDFTISSWVYLDTTTGWATRDAGVYLYAEWSGPSRNFALTIAQEAQENGVRDKHLFLMIGNGDGDGTGNGSGVQQENWPMVGTDPVGTAINQIGSAYVPENQWSHIVLQREGTTMRIYMDNVLVHERASASGFVGGNGSDLIVDGKDFVSQYGWVGNSTNPLDGTQTMRWGTHWKSDSPAPVAGPNASRWTNKLGIGGHSMWATGLPGKIDDVGVWTRALTTAEISELYHSKGNAIVAIEAAKLVYNDIY